MMDVLGIVKPIMEKHEIKSGSVISADNLQKAIAESIEAVITSTEYFEYISESLGQSIEKEKRARGLGSVK
jgi:hypothetical protein